MKIGMRGGHDFLLRKKKHVTCAYRRTLIRYVVPLSLVSLAEPKKKEKKTSFYKLRKK